MKLFLVGDFVKDTGPGVANKMIRKGLINKPVLYSDAKNKVTRILEMVWKIYNSDCVCFCSPSKGNKIGIKIAKLFKKPAFYVMHGYLTFETSINEPNISKKELNEINTFEKYLFSHCHKVFCVSKKFMTYMKKAEPEFSDKFDYNFNGLDLEKIKLASETKLIKKNKNQIISIGGGMRRKNNLTVCKAIDKLNKEHQLDLEYIVIGLPYTDKEKIKSYNFVTYYDQLPHKKVMEILSESILYIQNSNFETFGLSVIEALLSDCNLLISRNVGAIDVMTTINEQDIIFDTTDIDEIARKIKDVLNQNNYKRLQSGLDNQINYKVAGELLYNKINGYYKKGITSKII